MTNLSVIYCLLQPVAVFIRLPASRNIPASFSPPAVRVTRRSDNHESFFTEPSTNSQASGSAAATGSCFNTTEKVKEVQEFHRVDRRRFDPTRRFSSQLSVPPEPPEPPDPPSASRWDQTGVWSGSSSGFWLSGPFRLRTGS